MCNISGISENIMQEKWSMVQVNTYVHLQQKYVTIATKLKSFYALHFLYSGKLELLFSSSIFNYQWVCVLVENW